MPKAREQFQKILRRRKAETEKQYPTIAKKMAERIKNRTRRGFGTEGPLAPLALSTRKRKAREGKSEKSQLTDTREMLDSLQGTADRNIITITVSDENQDKAQYAREGSKNRPKREFLRFSRADNAALKKFIRQAITKG